MRTSRSKRTRRDRHPHPSGPRCSCRRARHSRNGRRRACPPRRSNRRTLRRCCDSLGSYVRIVGRFVDCQCSPQRAPSAVGRILGGCTGRTMPRLRGAVVSTCMLRRRGARRAPAPARAQREINTTCLSACCCPCHVISRVSPTSSYTSCGHGDCATAPEGDCLSLRRARRDCTAHHDAGQSAAHTGPIRGCALWAGSGGQTQAHRRVSFG